ncbi:hypothetical protein E1B28_010924 [Marasmius oreades]|uniref:Uncharacterized protein n=1 Tax=Marasmius oreades TaxID=181124 RepID=A0A9P7UPF6_9AGAR|nr:uncharacterized protein E1B28_010924 [Marasmius oreades]KAG7089223.1 hypothetical protein E1B28_010924 [Marasmius oreades]
MGSGLRRRPLSSGDTTQLQCTLYGRLCQSLTHLQQISKKRLKWITVLHVPIFSYGPWTNTIYAFYYNRSFSVIQSSGMGKSRLMDHFATLRFTIPFSIQESDANTYPSFDDQVRDFLDRIQP